MIYLWFIFVLVAPREIMKRNTIADLIRILKAKGKGRWDGSKTHLVRFGPGK